MTPPELARDAPRLDVLEPLEIGLLPGLRHEPRFARTHGGQRALGEGLHVHVPLIREIGLDHRAGAVAVRNRVRMRLDRDEKAALVEQRDDALARLEAIEAVEGEHRIRRIAAAVEPFEEGVVSRNLDLRFGTEHVDERQAVPPADLEIVEVVRRRDLHRARALFRIGVFVRDDRDFSADERQHGVLADEVAEALVVGVHRHGDVAEHRFGARRRDGDEAPRLALDRVADVPERALHLDLLHFEIGDRGLEGRVPVDEALVLVDAGPAGRGRRRLSAPRAKAPRPS